MAEDWLLTAGRVSTYLRSKETYSVRSTLLLIIRVSRFRPYLPVGYYMSTCPFVSLYHKHWPEFTIEKAFCQTRECAKTAGTMSEEVF